VLKTHGRTDAQTHREAGKPVPRSWRDGAAIWASVRLCVSASLLALAACAPRSPDPHARVACAGCHRGAVADTGRAAVPNAGCDRAGCHAPVSAEADTARMVMVRFRHRTHGADSVRAAVPCATCHTHRPGESTMVTDSAACALCHVTDIASVRAPRCMTCHPNPSHQRLTSQGVPISHAQILGEGVPCTRCHYELLAGRPDATVTGCRDCHRDSRITAPVLALLDSLRPRRGPLLRDTAAVRRSEASTVRLAALADSLHRSHTGYACATCHAPVQHRIVAMSTSVVLSCADCHTRAHRRPIPADTSASAKCSDCHEGVHAEEQRLILGLLPDEPIRPSPMFMGGVTCRSCHVQPGAPPLRPGQSLVASEAACTGCHGDQWRGVLPRWRRGYHRRETWATAYIDGAARVTADSAANPGARAKVRRATALLAFLRAAGPLHNLPASDRIMRDAIRLAGEAYASAGTPRAAPLMGPPVTTGTCISCHYGIEEVAADRDSVTGRQFTHGDHMVSGGLACDNCHAAGAPPPGLPDSLWIDTTRADRSPRRR
jgi:cytochrome c3-like protein/class III cytochrome C family protein